MKAMVARLGGFSASTIVSACVSLVLVPIVISTAGVAAWTHISVVQSLAAFFSVFVAFGWGVTGPALVAGAPQGERRQLFRGSLTARGLLFLLVAPIAIISGVAINQGPVVVSVLAMLIVLLSSLGASWYFVGEGRPRRLFLFDTLPKAVGNLIGALALLATKDIGVFLTIQLSATSLSVVMSVLAVLWTRAHSSGETPTPPVGNALLLLKSQVPGVVTAATASLYVNIPLVLVSLLSPTGAAVFALADKIMKFSLNAFTPIVQVAQGSIPQPTPLMTTYRARTASKVALFLGSGAGLLFAVGLPLVASRLSNDNIAVEWSVSIAFGLSFASIIVSQIVGLACLAALGRVRDVAASTILGALIGVPLVALLASVGGVVGASWALGISELAVLIYQWIKLRGVFRRDLPDANHTGRAAKFRLRKLGE